MDRSQKLAFIRKILYDDSIIIDENEKYITHLDIIATLSHYHPEITKRILIAHFHKWYKDGIDNNQPGDDDSIINILNLFLSRQSNKYLKSLKHLAIDIDISDIDAYIETIVMEICRQCIYKSKNESYHDIIKSNLHLTLEMEHMILYKNIPKHWSKEWTFENLDNHFQGAEVIIVPDLIPDTLSDEAIADILTIINL